MHFSVSSPLRPKALILRSRAVKVTTRLRSSKSETVFNLQVSLDCFQSIITKLDWKVELQQKGVIYIKEEEEEDQKC